MYQNPAATLLASNTAPTPADTQKWEEEFESFYEEVFEELGSYGEVEEMHVCDNLGDHLVGNVYVKYRDEEEAEKCQAALGGRFYAGKLFFRGAYAFPPLTSNNTQTGRPLVVEYSPVTEFREARCRQFDENTCGRGAYCNFMHIKKVPRSMMRELMEMQREKAKDR
jgi:splicing factor U2AF subunit